VMAGHPFERRIEIVAACDDAIGNRAQWTTLCATPLRAYSRPGGALSPPQAGTAAGRETGNGYGAMPGTVGEWKVLADRLEAIREANVAHHVGLARAAADAGASILGMGELFTGPYFALGRDPMWLGLLEDALAGPTVPTLRQARPAPGPLLAAPHVERDPGAGRRVTTASGQAGSATVP